MKTGGQPSRPHDSELFEAARVFLTSLIANSGVGIMS